MGEPAIRQAIQATVDTLVLRASRFRNLVVLVVSLILGVLFAFLLFRMPYLLALLLWLLPMVCVWMARDVQALIKWKDRVIQICNEGGLDVGVFRSTALQLKHLPQASVAGMMDLLPNAADDKKLMHAACESLAAERKRHVKKAILSGVGCVFISLAPFSSVYWFFIGLAIFSVASFLR